MSLQVRIPRALAAAAGLALGLAWLSAPARAAPLQPGLWPAPPALATAAQHWGPPPPSWGWGRPGWRHGWGPPPSRWGWGQPGWHHGWGPRCTVHHVRTWNRWRGGWIVRPVRRCW